MSEPSAPDAASFPQAIRMIVLSFASAMVILTVVGLFVIPAGDEPVPTWVVLAPLAPVAAGLLLARAIGFGSPALSRADTALSTTDIQRTALLRFQTSTLVRLVLTETPFLLVFAACFVLPYGAWPLVAAIGPALAAVLGSAWPSRRNVDRLADALEAEGVPSYLREAFGHA